QTVEKVAFHDPCFLGRYQGLYNEPREILRSIPGMELIEPERCRERSMCCGAGGGHFFMDLDTQERPASMRIREILDLGADILCVSCTFCQHMFEDALRLLPHPAPVRISDWIELLWTQVTGE
ncbi:MAG TPA: (Fe-S)-binding protein, partial [Planctomycetaceae bacterium]|nr:(Fe-S)-binding protein [Planctomycetaceae bacterium]